MDKLLFLCHRLPFPPNKGDKIRSFHWLKGLSEYFEIYLATFVDDADDMQYIDEVKVYCRGLHVATLNKNTAQIKSLAGLLNGDPLTKPYYYDKGLDDWVKQVISKENIKHVLVFSSSMAQYVEGQEAQSLRKIVDFVDIDSDKWRQYSERAGFPMRWVYQREAATLGRYEKKIAAISNVSLFVSNKEADMFSRSLDKDGVAVDYVNNGVDTEYFSPDFPYQTPYNSEDKILVFTGAMDYWANVDAAKWFATEIFPLVLEQQSNTKFYIVGSNPTEELLSLGNDQVVVTGRVEDIRPFIACADVVVAPMRIARGIQNKVLEAMAMAKPVVTTHSGFEGIDADIGTDVIVTDENHVFAKEVVRLCEGADGETIGKAARECVCKKYSWDSNIEKLREFLAGQ